MRERPSSVPAAHTANIVKQNGVYHLFMLVEGRWLETGITSRKFLEITQIADREFAVVHVNAPLDAPPPEKADAREGAGDVPRAKAS
jgi:hypothetical protein